MAQGRPSTPDQLVGLGGGGSRVVYRFMQQEWILDEVISDEYENDRHTIRARVIDTATSDNWHDGKYKAATDTIDKKIREEDGLSKEDGHIKFHKPKILPEILGDQWENPNQLTGEPGIRELCSEEGLNSWWLEKGRQPLKQIQQSGFAGGVSRKRAVSKALFHISEKTDNSVLPDPAPGHNVYIVAALGGGTGSGLAIDFARELDQTQTHLIAVIPDVDDQPNEKANAHAALSELEYAHLSDESPFETITLVPHLIEMNKNEAEFEMAVVRTIMAHVNGMDGGNLDTQIQPGGINAPPGSTTFSMAVPYTQTYDIQAREEAEDELDEFFENKEYELERESDLYEVVEEYLRNSFGDAVSDALDSGRFPENEPARREAVRLRDRIDRVRNEILEDLALEISSIGGDELDKIRYHIDDVLEGDALTFKSAPGELEEARRYVNKAPQLVKNRLENEQYFNYAVDETAYDLHKILVREFSNIEKRRVIWAGVSAINSDVATSEDRANLIRDVLREVILDSDTEYLASADVDLTRTIEEIESLISDLEGKRDELAEKYQMSSDELGDKIDRWQDKSFQYAKQLAAIAQYRDKVVVSIDDLSDEIEASVREIEGQENDTQVEETDLELSTAGPLDDMDTAGVAPLNDKLDKMGVSTIDTGGLTEDFRDVTTARRYHLTHGDRDGLFGRIDNQEDFTITVGSIGGSFDIQPDRGSIDVERPFNCEFNSSYIERAGEIDEHRQELIDDIVKQFANEFAPQDDLPTYEFDLDSGSNIRVPANLIASEVTAQLRSQLKRKYGEGGTRQGDELDASEVLNSLLDPKEIDRLSKPTEDGSINGTVPPLTRTLFEAYIDPIQSKAVETTKRLAQLTGHDDSPGLLTQLKQLKELADRPGFRVYEDDVDLPTAREMESEPETYGARFAEEYEGLYTTDFSREGKSIEDGDGVYIKRKQADPADIIDDPDHIGESSILESEEDEIENDFENFVRENIFDSQEKVAPINNIKPEGTGEKLTDLRYSHLSFRPMYMSKAFDGATKLDYKYKDVLNVAEKHTYNHQSQIYGAEEWVIGSPDEISMVMFIGGLYMDNIRSVTTSRGYEENYEDRYRRSEFVGEHHSIGLGGKWSYWQSIQDALDVDEVDELGPDYGAHIHRNTTSMTNEFVEELMIKMDDEDASAADIFLDMFEADAYESTIPLSEDE